MKRLLLAVMLCFAGINANGDEGWGPYVYQSPIVAQQAPIVQNFQLVRNYYAVPSPVAIMVPQYVPVTTYQNVLVERRYHCLFKRYEVVSVPQTLYVPIRY
jgi:hypothetical protein